MANLPYAPTSWVAGTTAVSQANMNNLETQSAVALSSFNPDLLSAFVLSGLVATKDGTIASQLDVTAGVAYLVQTDGTLGRRSLVSFTKVTTSPSTTFFLDLNPDGTVSWGTSHSAVTNHVTIASVTTDASSNILAVTDARTLTTTLLGGMSGSLLLTAPHLSKLYSDAGNLVSDGSGNVAISNGTTSTPHLQYTDTVHNSIGWTDVFAELYRIVTIYRGAGGVTNWSMSLQTGNVFMLGALGQVGGQNTAGSFGVPVVVAQAIQVAVNVTTNVTILSYTPAATGIFRVTMTITHVNASAVITAFINYTDPAVGAHSPALTAQNDGSTSAIALLAASFPTANRAIFPFPVTATVQGGVAITVNYQNTTATPNDVVTAIIERLA